MLPTVLDSEADGAMVDLDDADTLTRVLGEPEFADAIRLARRSDDPLTERAPVTHAV